MNHIINLVNKGRFADAAALAIYRKKTYETRSLFSKVKIKSEEKVDAFELLLLADAKTDFDCYCRYLDYRQPLSRNFYLDRRKYLKDIVDAVTNMYYPKDGAISYDVLRIKLPTRTGKSEVFNRVAFWVQGNKPRGETLYCVGGGNLKDSIHAKRESLIDEYWKRHTDVFNGARVDKIAKGSSSVWFNKKEYADIATVTVGGSIEGYVQCTNLLVLDDLVASSEIQSANRLNEIYESDILSAITRRIVGKPKVILIGTPIATQTGVQDPLDRYYEYRQRGGDKCKEFIMPALNEDMESNISYRIFENDGTYEWTETTEQILGERQSAYSENNEVEIATFETTRMMRNPQFGERRFATLQTYNLEPEGTYREINVLDPADGGGDNAVLMHCRIYDNDPDEFIYVHDIFRDKRYLDRVNNGGYLDDLANFLMKNDIHSIHYEKNLGGTLLGETIKDICEERKWHFQYEDFRQLKNKVQRITEFSGETIKRVRVRENSNSKMYTDSIQEIKSWTAKAAHDDDIDCLTKVVELSRDMIDEPNSYTIPSMRIF